MDRGIGFRALLILLVTLGCVWFLVPSYFSLVRMPAEQRNNVEQLKAMLPSWSPGPENRLSLGLDLQGGIHMVMRVDTKTALEKRVERLAGQIENYLKDKKLESSARPNPEKLQIVITPKDPATFDAVKKEVTESYEDLSVATGDPGALTVQLNDVRLTQFQDE